MGVLGGTPKDKQGWSTLASVAADLVEDGGDQAIFTEKQAFLIDVATIPPSPQASHSEAVKR